MRCALIVMIKSFVTKILCNDQILCNENRIICTFVGCNTFLLDIIDHKSIKQSNLASPAGYRIVLTPAECPVVFELTHNHDL